MLIGPNWPHLGKFIYTYLANIFEKRKKEIDINFTLNFPYNFYYMENIYTNIYMRNRIHIENNSKKQLEV